MSQLIGSVFGPRLTSKNQFVRDVKEIAREDFKFQFKWYQEQPVSLTATKGWLTAMSSRRWKEWVKNARAQKDGIYARFHNFNKSVHIYLYKHLKKTLYMYMKYCMK